MSTVSDSSSALRDVIRGKSAAELSKIDWSRFSPRDRLITLPQGRIDDGGPGWIGGYRTLGWELVRWASKFLKQPNGPNAGKWFKWVDSQILFFLWWYAIDEDGDWLFHRGARRLSKGVGKSPSMAIFALGELCANVRVKDFDDSGSVLGGVVGKQVAMPLVQIAATAESQTHNTMRMVRAFAPKGSRVVLEHNLDPGKTQYYRQPEGKLEVITSSATAAEGAEATAGIADEVHLWTPSNGGQELHDTLVDNLAKSGSRLLESNNAWWRGKPCVAQKTFDAWLDQEEGRTRNTTRILYDARMAPPDTNWSDEKSLMRMLDFVYDDCWWAPKKFYIGRIWDVSSSVQNSKRKYGNIPADAAGSWITEQEWSLLANPERVVADGEEVVMFLDGSAGQRQSESSSDSLPDATALIGCCIEDGHVFTIEVWEPTKDNPQIPVEEVDATVLRAKDRYKVRGFFSDVKEWESFCKVTWPKAFRQSGDIEVHAVPTGRNPELIAWDMRGHVYEFTKAAELARAEIRLAAKMAQEGSDEPLDFTHDGDSRLQRHVLNCREDNNRYGTSVRKETPNSPNKIDAAVCMIGARMVRRLWQAKKGSKRRPKTGRASFFS